MIVNISKNVSPKEMCRIIAIGNNPKIADHIDLTFSREALIGFATELLWLYDDLEEKNKQIITTYPLKVDPAPNQAIGFYLTPSSPTLAIRINYFDMKIENLYENNICKEIKIKEKNNNQYYRVNIPSEEGESDCENTICLETYELSRRNILDVRLVGIDGNEVTKHFSSVIVELNRKGIKALATMLLVWINNYNDSEDYMVFQEGVVNAGYNFGVILSCDSIPTRLKIGDFGTVYDHDSRF